MRKLCTMVLLLAVLLLGQLSVFASPDTIAPDSIGNSNGILVVTSPKNQKDSTFSFDYVISGYGKEGTVVTFYSYSDDEGVYKKMFNETQYIDANGVVQVALVPSEVKIGPSGLFMNSVALKQGLNNLLVRAENGDAFQLLKLSLTKYSYNLFDLIKSLTD